MAVKPGGAGWKQERAFSRTLLPPRPQRTPTSSVVVGCLKTGTTRNCCVRWRKSSRDAAGMQPGDPAGDAGAAGAGEDPCASPGRGAVAPGCAPVASRQTLFHLAMLARGEPGMREGSRRGPGQAGHCSSVRLLTHAIRVGGRKTAPREGGMGKNPLLYLTTNNRKRLSFWAKL